MEFLKSSKRRSVFSETAYIILNLLLAVAVFVVVLTSASSLPAFALVLLSKWRILAVRPRYWAAHIQSNMVDLIVSLGFVVLLVNADGFIFVQAAIAALYAAWLLVLKPRAKRTYMIAQAATAVFIGVTALSLLDYNWFSSLVVGMFWIIGYSVARHVLVAYDQSSHLSLLSLIWGFVFAEIGWLSYHWTVAYSLTDNLQLRIPQITIILLALSFMAERAYASQLKHGSVRSSDMTLPVLFSLSIIVILLLLFNDPVNSLH